MRTGRVGSVRNAHSQEWLCYSKQMHPYEGRREIPRKNLGAQKARFARLRMTAKKQKQIPTVRQAGFVRHGGRGLRSYRGPPIQGGASGCFGSDYVCVLDRKSEEIGIPDLNASVFHFDGFVEATYRSVIWIHNDNARQRG